MIATIAIAVAVCASAGIIGQAALRLCGVREWAWLAFAIGFSLMMVVAYSAAYLPGRALTSFLILIVSTIAGAAYIASDRRLWPPVAGLLAGIPVLTLTLIPFAAAGRSGILGVALSAKIG